MTQAPPDPSSPSTPPTSRDDRRDSPRLPMQFQVRDVSQGGSFEERAGDLAIGGVYFKAGRPPTGNVFEIRFRLPGTERDLQLKGELVRVSGGGEATGFHVRFVEVDVADELAIARFIDGA